MGENDFHVLLVDDEEDFLSVVAKRLAKRELRVATATSGEGALAHIEAAPVDVVVLDLKMPDMDGLQTLRAIKAMKPGIEVIMLTGHADLATAVSGMEIGAFDYLLKPTDVDELLYKLRDARKKQLLGQAKR
ncbi:MAG: response regulator [Desulfovibrionaceae bacterium]